MKSSAMLRLPKKEISQISENIKAYEVSGISKGFEVSDILKIWVIAETSQISKLVPLSCDAICSSKEVPEVPTISFFRNVDTLRGRILFGLRFN